MIGQLFTLDPRVALAFSAGFFTFLAPCAFPLLPGYVAYFVGTGDDEPRPVSRRLVTAVGVATVVSGGFFLVNAVVAGVAFVVGSGPLRNVSVLEPAVGLVLILLGIAMLSGRFQPSALHVQLPERRRSGAGFFLFGVVYAVAAIGCTGPIFLGLALFAIESGPTTSVVIFGAYGLGMSVMMLGVTLLAALGREAVIRRISGTSGKLTRVAGAVLVVAGVAQIYAFLFLWNGFEVLGLA